VCERMTDRDQYVLDQLDELALRFESRGFLAGQRNFFADNGIVIVSGPSDDEPPPGPDGIVVIGRCVFLYWGDAGWEARITPHGGPHWIKHAASIAALESVALEALATDQTPPSDGWMRA
jgi:hypothetical protein